MGNLIVIRHGQTEWSATGRHTSRTDLALTAEGERQGRAVALSLAGRAFAAVLSSPRQRALRTAEFAGLVVTAVDSDLAEWDYGDFEGLTTMDIRESRPDWDLWADGCPGGESPTQVGARADRVLARVRPLLAAGDVAVVGHGHSSRVLAARWIGLPPVGGALLHLDTATVCTLGFEHARPVVLRWNVPPN